MGDVKNATDPEILKLLNKIVSQNNDIKKDIEEIKKDLSVQSLKIDSINIKVAALEEENSNLKKKLSAIERKSKRNNFIIFGIGEEVTDVLHFVENLITDKLDVTVTHHDINNIYRVGQKASERPRPVLLELTTNLKKQEISKKLHKLKNTGIVFSNDLIPQDREEQKVLQYHLKLAKQKQYNAKITKNKLMVNGETYSYQDLTSINTEKIKNKNKQNKNNSAPATPVTNCAFTYVTEENKEDHTEVNQEKEVSEYRKESTSTPGTSDSTGPRNKRTNITQEKEYITRSSKKQKM